MEATIAALMGLGVLEVFSAARGVGVGFKNGLTKGEVVDLLRERGKLEEAWEYVQRVRKGTNTPSPVIPSPQPSAPVLAPVQPPPAAAPSGDAETLAAAIRAIAGNALNEAAVLAIVQRAMEGERETIAAWIAREVAKIPQGTVVHFPGEREPIQLESITHANFGKLVQAMEAGEIPYLVGPSGTGKTHAAEQAAEVYGLKLKTDPVPYFLCGRMIDAHDLFGYQDAQGQYVETDFFKAWAAPHAVLLLDEVDGYDKRASLALNAALSNGYATFPGKGRIRRSPGLWIMAAGNTDGTGATVEFGARTRLDGALRNRFIMLEWHNDPRIEKLLANGDSLWLAAVRAVREFAKAREIMDTLATPRDIKRGPKLVAAGWAREDVFAGCFKVGALAAEWDTVRKLPDVAEYLAGF